MQTHMPTETTHWYSGGVGGGGGIIFHEASAHNEGAQHAVQLTCDNLLSSHHVVKKKGDDIAH